MQQFLAKMSLGPTVLVCLAAIGAFQDFSTAEPPVVSTPSPASKYPIGRDYVAERNALLLARPGNSELKLSGTDPDRWQSLFHYCGMMSGVIDYSLEKSPTLHAWADRVRPANEEVFVYEQIADGIRGRYDIGPISDELKAIRERCDSARYWKFVVPFKARTPCVPPLPTKRPIILESAIWLSSCRGAARLNNLFLLLAIRDGNTDVIQRAFESNFVIADVINYGQSSLTVLVANGIRMLAMTAVAEAITKGQVSEDTLAGLSDVLRTTGQTDWKYFCESERLASLDAIDLAYTNREWFLEISSGDSKPLKEFSRSLFEENETDLASREECLAKLDEQFELAKQLFDSPSGDHQQASAALASFIENLRVGDHLKKWTILSILNSELPHLVRTERAERTLRAGLLALIAIESYKKDHGKPPVALSDLVPKYLPSVPEDLCAAAGTPLKYRLVDPATDRASRSYVLYSVGTDGKDNQGVDDPLEPWYMPNETTGDTDFTINSVKQWPKKP